MKRFHTRVVKVGHVEIGGNNPVRIQSMTNTDTADVIRTSEQIMRLEDCGCEIVRLTVQGAKEAYSCEKIKSILIQKGYKIPLVADIHFFPKAAILVSDFVDKVRINPGNFVKQPKSSLDIISKIEAELFPLIEKLKSQKKALRIGVNHGSLSENIMELYGNTPEGMVQSAIQYGEIIRKFGFNDLIFSMKASNPIVMISAYRLLVSKMTEKSWDYPLHLGVTEAGDEEDGIIKSAVGIGSLLLDGIGDTIRVSLTADPEKEIPPARKLARLIDKQASIENILPENENPEVFKLSSKREVDKPSFFGKKCFAILEGEGNKTGHNYVHADAFFCQNSGKGYLASAGEVYDEKSLLLAELDDLKGSHILKPFGVFLKGLEPSLLNKLLSVDPEVIFFSPERKLNDDLVSQARYLNQWLFTHHKRSSLITGFSYAGEIDDITICAAAELGALLAFDIIDGICLRGDFPLEDKYRLTCSILQESRKKITKTEYISCPGCGRTLYDIQTVTKNIKAKTSHLLGLKIAIMGCIVNGPGEMADADFGFIGSGKNKIDLYVGNKCVEKNIDFSMAEEKLIEIIKKEGKWVEHPAKCARS